MDPRHEAWEVLGRAAERFARRVADDARFFADRVEEHVSELARNVRREWREGRVPGPGSSADARRIFDDVRGMVRDVVEDVDELLEEVFRRDEEAGWSRVTLWGDERCGGCGRWLPAGVEAWVLGGGGAVRCGECGGAP